MLRRAIFALAVLWAAAAQAQLPELKPSDLPGTPAGDALKGVLRAFSEGDAPTMTEFISGHYAKSALQRRGAEQRAATWVQLFRDTGGLTLRRLDESTVNAVTVLAEARDTGEWYRLRAEVEPEGKHQLLGVAFEPAARPAEFAPHVRLTDEQVGAELDRYVSALAKRDAFAGVVVLARNGTPFFEKAWGSSLDESRGGSFKNTLDSRFGLASLEKLFIAISVAQLAEQGKLAFSDPLAKYLPEFPNGGRIMLHHLLTHTAGLPALLEESEFAGMRRANVRTFQDLIDYIGKLPPVAAPGEGFHYSNADYMLLEGIVSVVSGLPNAEYQAEHIAKPLGMTRTGNGYSTAPDLTRLAAGLLSNKLLSPAMTATLMQGKVDEGNGARYAYGLEDTTVNGRRVVGHSGNGAHIGDRVDMYPDDGTTVVVMSDRPGGVADRIAIRARELLTQR